MKKTIFALIALNLFLAPLFVFSAGTTKTIMPSANSALAGDLGNVSLSDQPIDQTLNTVANYAIGVLIAVSVFYIIWAGYTFVMSGTDPDKVGEARRRIMFAGIGVIVALIAKGIMSLVLSAIK